MTLVVTIDGVDKSEADLVAAGVSPTTARTSYTDQVPAEFKTNDAFDAASPMLRPGQIVRVKSDGVIVAYGKCVEREVSFKPGEGRTFTLLPARELARNVAIQHPKTHAASIDFNTGEADDLQPTTLEGLTIGEIIAYILDNHATELRAQGAAPAAGALYEAADLTGGAMDAEMDRLTVSGDVLSAVEGLLTMTSRGLVIDPDTLKWRFRDRTAGSYLTVDVASDHVEAEVQVSIANCFTAAELRGSRPETADTVYSILNGDMALPAADQAKLASLTPATKYTQDYKTVGKVLEMADGDVGIIRDLCAKARVTSADGTVDVDVPVRADTPTSGAASIALPLPTIGVFNPSTPVDACSDPSGQSDSSQGTGGLSVTLPTYSRAAPLVPKLRYPTTADSWYGSAFSFDPTKYGVGGATPDAGDYGHERLRTFNVPRYHGTSAENTAWALVLEEIVKIGGTVGREVRVTINGRIDTTCVLLGYRLRIQDTAGRTTGYEATTDLAIVGVEWDFMRNTTTLIAGNGVGLFNLDAYRAGIAARQGLERAERSMDWMREIVNCFIDTDQASAFASDLPPISICAGQVVARGQPGKPPIPMDKVPSTILGGILDILSWQKGWKLTFDEGNDGNVTLRATNPNTGAVHHYDPNANEGAGGWVNGSDVSPAGKPPMGQDADGPDGPQQHLPTDGPEGWTANAVKGLLANAGKTTDGRGNVLKPGGSAPGGSGKTPPGATAWGHDSTGAATGTNLKEGDPIPPTTLGGLLGNAAKSVKEPGVIGVPGDAVP